MQRGAAENSFPADESSCAGQHRYLFKRDLLLGITDIPLLRALRPIANVHYLYRDLFYACLQYRAFLGRPKSNREGNGEEDKWFAHGELSPPSEPGSEIRTPGAGRKSGPWKLMTARTLFRMDTVTRLLGVPRLGCSWDTGVMLPLFGHVSYRRCTTTGWLALELICMLGPCPIG